MPKVKHYGNQPAKGPKRVGVASRLAKDPGDLDAPADMDELRRRSGTQLSTKELNNLVKKGFGLGKGKK